MDETLRPNPIERRLAMQDEVIKWITEFSETMEKRANEATAEVNGLLDQAGALEVELKNAFNSFRCLSLIRHVEHRIAEDNDVARYRKKSGNHSVELSIPAQDYETDILPRYKEALSLGLISCKNYLQSANRGKSVTSFFSTASLYGQLPHIIGSEEYNHDNSCGLSEDTASGPSSLDSSCIMEPTGVSSVAAEHDPSDLFNPRMLNLQQDLSRKDGSEPLVSAALDFKAMLEAALLNTYKFYDEESSSVHDTIDGARSIGETTKDMSQEASTSSQAITISSSQHLKISEEEVVPAAEGNLTLFPDTDFYTPELYSVLVSGNLFDADGDLGPAEEPSLDKPAPVATTSPESLTIIDEEVFAHKASLEDVSTLQKDVTFDSMNLLPDKLLIDEAINVNVYAEGETFDTPEP